MTDTIAVPRETLERWSLRLAGIIANEGFGMEQNIKLDSLRGDIADVLLAQPVPVVLRERTEAEKGGVTLIETLDPTQVWVRLSDVNAGIEQAGDALRAERDTALARVKEFEDAVRVIRETDSRYVSRRIMYATIIDNKPILALYALLDKEA